MNVTKTVKRLWTFGASSPRKDPKDAWYDYQNLKVNILADSFDAAYVAFKQEYPDYNIWSVSHQGKTIVVDKVE
jgi:hypothetical protein